MKTPHLKPADWLRELSEQQPAMRFPADGTSEQFRQWKRAVRNCLHGQLKMEAEEPGEIETTIKKEFDHEGCRRIELEFINPFYNLIVPSTILIPPDGTSNGAGLVCQHGHGNFGRRSVIGEFSSPDQEKEISHYHYDYALKFAQNGYTIIAIDLLNFGERKLPAFERRDTCDVLGLFLSLFGMNLVGVQTSDILLATSILARREEVDAERIGICGLSQGGRMSMFAAALDDRFKAVVASGIINTYADRVATLSGACGAQIVPGLLEKLDTPDIFASLAPLPLQVQWGLNDSLILEDYALPALDVIRRGYTLLGAESHFELDQFEGGHAFNFEPALAFMNRHLTWTG